ncbi:MAG: tRNA (adenosine(37)-N6)-threonylcarbamoyltransferase complex dimerization subunit type 1 TsaB [Bacilli bacterium]|jgi:tRNA threonylcarbamoyladenosine biosynthesis protein TsaB|nr:tRNA (adenosine(37)-N6)-threonylcarbamoyltransferase complex dimerization subunit type 1 TsaB [Bacilli bacterium]
MKTLFIDTSTSFLVIAFLNNQEMVYSVKKEGKNNHSDHLLNEIQIGLKAVHLDFKDLDRIIVAIGPGAYTGLRVSLTVAKMLCWTLSIPLYTISSLESLGSGFFHRDGTYILAMHAKKGFVFSSIVRIKNGLKEVLQDEGYLSLAEWQERKNAYPEAVLIHEENADWDISRLDASFFMKQESIHLVEPNYLRGEL